MKGKLWALALLCAVWILSACGAAPSGSPTKSALSDTSATEETAPDASARKESAPEAMEPDASVTAGLEPDGGLAPEEIGGETFATDESAGETFGTGETVEEAFLTGESAGETFGTGETAGETSATGETAGEASVTGETAGEASVTGETVGEASVTGETAGETLMMTQPAPDANVLASPERPSFALPGTWHSDVGADILTIYENGGFELTDASSYYEGYLLYADEDGGPWESGPRYEMYLENNERLPSSYLTWDDGHPGKLVYVVGGGAELFSRGDCAYDEDGIAVRARWADENVLSAYAGYDEYAAYSGEYEADILYVTERTLRNFKALSISLEEADEDGTAVFAVTELFEENSLTPERPLLVRTSFPGDMPTNGISYADESGETRYFSVSESGFDGSLILSEFRRSEKP